MGLGLCVKTWNGVGPCGGSGMRLGLCAKTWNRARTLCEGRE